MPEAALTSQLSALEDRVYYYGWGKQPFEQRLVDIDTLRRDDATSKGAVSSSLPVQGNAEARAWNDLLFDYTTGEFWGSFDFDYVRYFYSLGSSSPSLVATASLAVCRGQESLLCTRCVVNLFFFSQTQNVALRA